MDDLESAVLLCLNPTAEKDLREQALNYCQNLRQSRDGWAFVLQHLSTAMRPEVAFWCLQVIHETLSDPARYPVSFSGDQKTAIRTSILQYFSKVVFPQKASNRTGAGGGSRGSQAVFPKFLLNKLSQVLVSVIAADYPHTWPTAFQESVLPLAASAQSNESSTAIFFRVLRALDEDVTSIRATQISEHTRKTSIRVKDGMREDCIAAITGRCADLISSPMFISHAFDFFSRYVEWVDIGLIVQERIIAPMYGAITTKGATSARPAAAVALRSVILKRMDSAAKISLLNTLQIEALLRSIPVDEVCSHEEEIGDPELNHQTGQVEVAALVNTTAVVALEVLKETMKQSCTMNNVEQVAALARSVAQVALPVALLFLDENVDEGTSSQTLQCVTTYVSVFSRATKNGKDGTSDEGIEAVRAILKVVEERSLFPKDFDPDDDASEEQRSFFEVRKILLKNIFGSVARAFPMMCVEFVNSLFSKAVASADCARTELALAVLISLTVTSPETPELLAVRSFAIANPPACMKFSTDVANSVLDKAQIAQKHQLEAVSTTYFDMVARSYRMFLTRAHPGLLASVLPVFLDTRGLGHQSSETVQSHAAYFFLKLIRPLRSIIAGNHLDAIINAMRVHMFPLKQDVGSQGSKNQMMMFEIVGYLLGTDHKKEGSMQYLSAALQSLVDGLQGNNAETVLPFIMAAGYLSKGFGVDSKPLLLLNEPRSEHGMVARGSRHGSPDALAKEVKVQRITPLSPDMQSVWIACLEAVLKGAAPYLGLQNDTSTANLKSKLIFFLHRMVDTIGMRVLSYLEQSVPGLLDSSTTAVDVRDVIILVSQAITKFGNDCRSLVMRMYAPIVQKAHQHPYSLDSTTLMAMSEESREAVEMQRAYTYFMHAVIGTELVGVLIHPNHQALVQGVMSSLLSSAVGESLDLRVSASVMKMSLHMLGQLVKEWAGVNSDKGKGKGPEGFTVFALKEISNASVMSGLRGCLFRKGDYDGGEAVSVVTEIVTLQRTCSSNLGQAFGEALQNGPLGSLPKGDVNAYISALFTPDTAVATLVPAFSTLCKMLRQKG